MILYPHVLCAEFFFMIRLAASSSIGLLFLLFLCMPGQALTAATPAVPKSETFSLPAIKQDCTTCHGSPQQDKGKLLLKKPLAELCLECHPGRIAPTEHKIGIISSMNTASLPLVDSKLTCITCHDPHSNRYGRMLRVPVKNLCRSCHLK